MTCSELIRAGDRPSHYVRDDRPFGGQGPPAALFDASRDRRGEHPARHRRNFAGILQADAYSGFNALFDPGNLPRPPSAGRTAGGRSSNWDIAQHARRGRSATAISPIALEAVRRIDQLFEIEREIYGSSAAERLRIRQERSASNWLASSNGGRLPIAVGASTGNGGASPQRSPLVGLNPGC